MWTILIFIVIGMVAGWAASLLIRRDMHPTDWGVLFIIGIAGSLDRRHPDQPAHGRGLQDRAPAASSAPSSSRASCSGCTRACRTAASEQQPRGPPADGQHRERKGGKKHHSKR